MNRCAAGAALCIVLRLVAGSSSNHGYKSSLPWLPRDPVIRNPTGDQLVANRQLPKHFDWRNVDGRNLVTSDVNQHILMYCGACWVFGATSALNDRIKVMRGGAFPDVTLSFQALLNCVPPADGKGPNPGCNGGDAWMIHKYMHEHKVPDATCQPYQARNMECVPENVCRNCLASEDQATVNFSVPCYAVKEWIGYGVTEYGRVAGESAMMKEIYARGPIACQFAFDASFPLNYSSIALQHEGVFMTDVKYNASQIDHVMEVAGWGETPLGVKFWVVRNSWGTYWGELGWLKIKRGDDQLLMESSGCDWAVPEWHDLDEGLTGKVMGDYIRGIHPVPAAEATPILSSFAAHDFDGSASTSVWPIFFTVISFSLGAFITMGAARKLHTHTSSQQPSLLG